MKKFQVPESSVRNFKKAYILEMKSTKEIPTELLSKHKGKPLLLGELDSVLQK